MGPVSCKDTEYNKLVLCKFLLHGWKVRLSPRLAFLWLLSFSHHIQTRQRPEGQECIFPKSYPTRFLLHIIGQNHVTDPSLIQTPVRQLRPQWWFRPARTHCLSLGFWGQPPHKAHSTGNEYGGHLIKWRGRVLGRRKNQGGEMTTRCLQVIEQLGEGPQVGWVTHHWSVGQQAVPW